MSREAFGIDAKVSLNRQAAERIQAHRGVGDHLEFVRRARRGELERPAFRLFFSPVTELATLIFLLFVIVEMGVDGGTIGRWTVALIVPIVAALVFGWKARGRRERAARP